MTRFFSYMQIILYSLWKRWTKPHRGDKSKKILIVMDQLGVGDAICSLDSFYNFALHTKDTYELYIATTAPVINFLKETQSTFDAHFITLDVSQDTKFDIAEFKQNYHHLDICHWHNIIFLNRIGIYMKLLFMGCRYDKMLGMEFFEQKISILEHFLFRQIENYKCLYFHYFTHIMQIHAEVSLKALRELVDSNQDIEYKCYKIPCIADNPLAQQKGRYCIICPSIAIQKDHPYQYRKWPMDRFVDIVDFILDSSDLYICLSGVKSDQADNEYLEAHVKNPSRIINMTGKTTFKEWIELIRGADFVLGNDSGYIHLASYLGVQAFALAGYWNYGRFLPYPPKQIHGRITPIDIRIPRVSCEGCNLHRKMDFDRQQCNQLVKEKGVYKCIWDINGEMVKKVLAQHLHIHK